MSKILHLPKKSNKEVYLLHFTSEEEARHIREKVRLLANKVKLESECEIEQIEEDASAYAERKFLNDHPILNKIFFKIWI